MKRVAVMFTLMCIYAIFCLLLALFAPQARAHSWYPVECCFSMDCAPVDVTPRRDGDRLHVTTKHGEAWTDAETKIHEVPAAHDDGKVHACIIQRDGKSKVRCVFFPGAM